MQAIRLPYYFFRLQLSSETENWLLYNFKDDGHFALNSSPSDFAADFAQAFQKEILDTALYSELLAHAQVESQGMRNLSVLFENTKESLEFSELRVDIDYFCYRVEGVGFFAVLPMTEIEVFSSEEEDIEKLLEDAVRVDFQSNGRLKNLPSLFPLLWYERIEFLEQELELEAYSQGELALRNAEKKSLFLEKKGLAPLLDVQEQELYGYEQLFEKLVQALTGRFAHNLLLCGPSGVGKSSLIREFARRKKEFGFEANLRETTAASLIRGLTGEGGGWQEQLSVFCSELKRTGDWLYISNFYELFEVGHYAGNSQSLGAYLKSAIERGDVRIISELRSEELAQLDLQHPGYSSLFQVLTIEAPKEGLPELVLQKTQALAQKQAMQVEEEAVQEAIRLSQRYSPYSAMPAKPIRLLQTSILNRKGKTQKLERADVLDAFCEETGMPAFLVNPDMPLPIKELRSYFKTRLFGQDHAIETLIDVLASVKTALLRPAKPIASLLLVGPTGVGKTELAKILAQRIFGNKERMLRFDMSEYASVESFFRLRGTAQKEGVLSSAVRQQPFSVLLFDELEKAHPLFNDLLLQILGEGRLSDERGQSVDFCSTLILMTSNIGAESLQFRPLGWKQTLENQQVSQHFDQALRKFFRPEIYNRLDSIIPFYPLNKEVMTQICERLIAELKERKGLKKKKYQFHVDEEVLSYLSQLAYDPASGARALQRRIEEELVQKLAKELLKYDGDERLDIQATAGKTGIDIQIHREEETVDELMQELELSQTCERLGNLRRKLNDLQAGFVLRSIEQDTQDYQRAMYQKKQEEFWGQGQALKDYEHKLELQKQAKELAQELDLLEKKAAYSFFELSPEKNSTDLDAKGKLWEQKYIDFMVELYAKQRPEESLCCLGIYGLGPDEKILDALRSFYEQLFDQQGYSWTCSSLWYNRELFAGRKEGQDGYERQRLSPGQALPVREAFLFIGIEYQVTGPAALLYLGPEKGLHRWEETAQREESYYVDVQVAAEAKAPKNIHNSLPKAALRRQQSKKTFEDIQYKVAPRSVANEDYRLRLIRRVLQRLFRRALQDFLV